MLNKHYVKLLGIKIGESLINEILGEDYSEAYSEVASCCFDNDSHEPTFREEKPKRLTLHRNVV